MVNALHLLKNRKIFVNFIAMRLLHYFRHRLCPSLIQFISFLTDEAQFKLLIFFASRITSKTHILTFHDNIKGRI